MAKRYLLQCLLTIACVFLLTGCDLPGEAQPTTLPFAAFTAQQVLDSLRGNGLEVTNVQRAMLVQRGAPSEFADRYTFEIPRIAPNGGQVIVFASQAQRQSWEDYIEDLRRDDISRREVIYVYFHENVMLQVNANLTNAEATSFREALFELAR